MTVDWNDAEIQRALIQGGLTAAGVIVGALASVGLWFLNRRADRERARELRDERRDDLRKAIWTDLMPLWLGLYLLGDAKTKESQIETAFKNARERGDHLYTPYIMPVAEPLFSGRVVEDVAVLDHGEIEAIVRCYHQLARLNQMVENLRGDKFQALSPDRKESAMRSVTKLEVQAVKDLRAAILTLEPLLDLPDDKKMEMQERRADVRRLR